MLLRSVFLSAPVATRRVVTLVTGTAISLALANAQAAAPLTNCTDPGGVLSNNNQTCTFTVTTNGDSVDTSNPAEYVALAGSLRTAILNANAWGNYGNTVAGNSVIDVTALGGQTITIATALPLIASNLSIVGPSAGLTIVAINDSRCLFVSGLPTANQSPGGNDGAPQAINVSLSNLRLTQCIARAGSGHTSGLAAGGALFVNQNATVSLSNVAFQSNQAMSTEATGSNGGGGGGMGSSSTLDSGGGLGGADVGDVGGGKGIGSGFNGQQCTSSLCGGGGFGGIGLGQISVRQGFSQAAGNGGLNGGGGGGSGGNGHGSGAGGSNRYGGGIKVDSDAFKGGVGGGGAASGGGAGGFGGGGGSGASGKGGFGGGGGRFGHGGFGGGGGSGGGVGGFGGGGSARAGGFSGGAGGFEGGNGDPAALSTDGGTGAALGGAVFVVQGGSVVFTDTMTVSGSVLTTAAASGGATSGAALGKGIFLEGSSTLTFAPGAGTTQTISDDIADQRGSWLALGITAQAFYTTGGVFRNPPVDGTANNYWSYSNDGRWSMVKNGAGTLLLSGANTFSGVANAINAGTLQVGHQDALGIAGWTNDATLELLPPATNVLQTYNIGLSTALANQPSASYVQSASGTLRVSLYGSSCRTTVLDVRNDLILAGTIHIEAVNGCTPNVVPRRTFLANSRNSAANLPGVGSNKFNNTTWSGFPAGFAPEVRYDNSQPTRSVAIHTIAVACPVGTFSATGNGPCIAATAGNFVATTGATSQTPCGAGRSSTQGASACSGLLNIDFSDAPHEYSALTDGLILMRHLRGVAAPELTVNASGTNARRDAALAASFIAANLSRFDVDGDGQTLAESDGVMIVRRLLGFSGAALTANAKLGSRSDQQVQDAIDALKP